MFAIPNRLCRLELIVARTRSMNLELPPDLVAALDQIASEP